MFTAAPPSPALIHEAPVMVSIPVGPGPSPCPMELGLQPWGAAAGPGCGAGAAAPTGHEPARLPRAGCRAAAWPGISLPVNALSAVKRDELHSRS